MQTVIDREELKRRAPSVFAEEPAQRVSDTKYRFIPTTDVVSLFEKNGWYCSQAIEQRVKKDDRRGFQKHSLKFEPIVPLVIGDTKLQVVMTNSHDGLSSFRFNIGLFRQACANGLIVGDSLGFWKITHSGYKNENVIDVIGEVIETAPKLTEHVRKMQSITLSEPQRLAFAKAAITLKFGDKKEIVECTKLLRPRRVADSGKDLWTSFNVIQENILKGGVQVIELKKGNIPGANSVKYDTLRKVNSIGENQRLNKGLWVLAEEMAKLSR